MPPDDRIRMHPDPLQHQATERTQRLLDKAADHLGVSLPAIEIRFDLRGRAAGQARFGRHAPWVVRYNPHLLAANPRRFIAETVPHEVAHLAAFARHGNAIRPHGPEWQAIMRTLGAEPRRCHDFDVSTAPTRRIRRYAYHCDCRDHELSSIRHNRVLSGQTYLCRSCAQPLRPGSRFEDHAHAQGRQNRRD